MATPVERTATKRTRRALLTRGALAVAGSLLINWPVVAVIRTTGVVGPADYFQFGPVSLWTAVGAVGAAVVYRVVDHVSDTPDRTFTIVAAIVLVLSFGPNVGLYLFDPDATVGGVAGLMSMHVTTAVVCVATLTDYARDL